MNFSDLLCVWYLRFNGYFTMANFIAHGQPASLTDFDVVGVHFRESRELTFTDDTQRLRIPEDVRVDVILVETTSKLCKINGPCRYLWDSLLHEKLLDLKSLEQGWVQTLRKESSN